MHGQKLFLRPELPRAAKENFLVPCRDHASRCHGVLHLESLNEILSIDAESGQCRVRELNVDLLILDTHQIDFGDIWHLQQFGADGFNVIPELSMTETVRR